MIIAIFALFLTFFLIWLFTGRNKEDDTSDKILTEVKGLRNKISKLDKKIGVQIPQSNAEPRKGKNKEKGQQAKN